MATSIYNNLKSIHQVPPWLNSTLPLGDQVRQIREALGMTQQQLAERCLLHQSVIAEIESGKRKDLCLSTIQKLATGLNCQTLIQIVPQKEISQILDERSTNIAQKIVSMSSSSAPIEMQRPNQNIVNEQINEIKKDLLEKHKSVLWQEI